MTNLLLRSFCGGTEEGYKIPVSISNAQTRYSKNVTYRMLTVTPQHSVTCLRAAWHRSSNQVHLVVLLTGLCTYNSKHSSNIGFSVFFCTFVCCSEQCEKTFLGNNSMITNGSLKPAKNKRNNFFYLQ
jgi:hypothetical protein